VSNAQRSQEHQERAGQVFEVIIRLGLVFLLLFYGLQIVSPFLHPLMWGAILAVALYPAFERLVSALGGRSHLAGGLFIFAGIALVIVPAAMLAAGSMDGMMALAEHWQAGDLRVPPPSDNVLELPVVGETVHARWLEASENLEGAVERFAPQLKALGGLLLGMAASAGGILLLLTFSLVIAGILMARGPACIRFSEILAERLVGEDGKAFLQLATATIRGVATGVIGTAAIQAAAAALGFVAIGVPVAGLWAVLVLLLGVMQLPPLLVLVPIAIWSFSGHGTVVATVFTIWCLLVALSENVLKPLLMGRGLDIPMLVLLIGALGGMILSGIMGLFVGAVVLAVIYRLFGAWLGTDAPAATEAVPRPTGSA
jgi:predicted PurR-regulated permease PerM